MESNRVSRRWRTATVLALGVAIGMVVVATPAGGHVGGTVSHLWSQHIRPEADDRYLQRTIQAGRTVRGTIGNEETVAASVEVSANASLPGAAPFALDDEHVTVDGTFEDTGQCNGTVANPTAQAGWVCIYLYYESNVGEAQGYIWGPGDGEVKWGFQASAFSVDAGAAGWFGTWAYKAPASAPTLLRSQSRTSQAGGGS